MAELLAESACAGLLPVAAGGVRLEEIIFEAVTSVTALKGQAGAVSKALKTQIGAGMPEPNRTTGEAHARAVWSGPEQALLLGPVLSPIEGAAITDQSDGWAAMALEGPGARDVLARLVPVDLRASVFAEGHAARTMLGHMNAVLLRAGPDRYGLLVFRSMAATAVHEIRIAMEAVAARG